MQINLQRRQAVMARSVKLGYCVCNTQQSCPCDALKNFNVCPCAGEKMPPQAGPVALTRYVRKAGCASKIGQADLKRILGRLPALSNPNVLLGMAAGDDAGVYRLDDSRSLVQTVDVFTPCVDDAYLFGQIAAANSLSDIYAMGARPITALSIVGFPIDDLDGSIMEAMLRGGLDKLAEADCSLIGGHSLIDEEIKCGFAITGLINTNQVVARDQAQAGDALVLTKPLGTGMISFAAQLGRLAPKCLAEVGAVMATLNKDAAELMLKYKAHAATDITGFGLMGHLVEMARNSGVTVALSMSALPVFAAAVECLENEILSGAIERNQEYAMAWVRGLGKGNEKNLPILYDPQTSGGLLISLPEEAARQLVDELRSRGHLAATIVGRVIEKDIDRAEGGVIITNTRLANIVGSPGPNLVAQKNATAMPAETALAEAGPSALPASPDALAPVRSQPPAASPVETELACCAGAGDTAAFIAGPITTSSQELADRKPDAPTSLPVAVPQAAEAGEAFMAFLKRANQPGGIDQRT